MRTFLCALCILLLMLSFILIYNGRMARQVEAISEAVSALPEPGEADCAATVASLEAKWQDIRSAVGLAVNNRTLEEIDRLVASLRVTAAFETAVTDLKTWEQNRSLLILQLAELKKLMGCGAWEIV